MNLSSSAESRFFFYITLTLLCLLVLRKLFKCLNFCHKKRIKNQIKKTFNIKNLETQPFPAQKFANGLTPDFSINGRLSAIVLISQFDLKVYLISNWLISIWNYLSYLIFHLNQFENKTLAYSPKSQPLRCHFRYMISKRKAINIWFGKIHKDLMIIETSL